ncbi:multiubiquitin domain-containing protein [Geothrix sp. 21YS21S-2]|uniref:multiubiquitin domain-containing protein n=1 Tax=Geothrix sp. 21YS21S-2 TaxID=3068893 RepID=UPI0027BA0A59|nr:multiubiquitin domain-containing protein [Geothrix sp. 21YS21S-2]
MHETGSESVQPHQVRIHIDQSPYHASSPTTGEALYRLGQVAEGLVLFREVRGDEEDQPIANGPEPFHLQEDDHFHTGPKRVKEVQIFVNGTAKMTTGPMISFDQLVALAFNPIPSGPNILFTISYEDGPRENREGSLKEGQSVHIKKEMIFNVTTTDKS